MNSKLSIDIDSSLFGRDNEYLIVYSDTNNYEVTVHYSGGKLNSKR